MPTKQIESLSASAMAKSRLKSGGRDGFLGHRVLAGSLARRQIDREKCESQIPANLINTGVVDVGRRFECRIGKRSHVRMNAPQVAQSPEKEVSSLGLSTAAVAEALEMVLRWPGSPGDERAPFGLRAAGLRPCRPAGRPLWRASSSPSPPRTGARYRSARRP